MLKKDCRRIINHNAAATYSVFKYMLFFVIIPTSIIFFKFQTLLQSDFLIHSIILLLPFHLLTVVLALANLGNAPLDAAWNTSGTSIPSKNPINRCFSFFPIKSR